MTGARQPTWARPLALAATCAGLARGVVAGGTCVPCTSEAAPPAGEFPTSLNGIKWPNLCVKNDGSGKDHFFTIGDWGGFGRFPPRTFDNTRKKRPYIEGMDTNAQMNVANVMKKVAATSKPQFFINVGDNLYPAGVETNCGQTNMCNVIHTGQWWNSFTMVYDGPDLSWPVWMGVLGNHDWGGWQFNKGWDQSIAYTWHSDRWLTPALFWERRVQFCDYSVDFYFVDSNVMDAWPAHHDPEHNICGALHNGPATCAHVDGPTDAESCMKWFTQLDNQQKKWLEKRLQQSDADWQIVVTHFTPQWGAPFWTKMAQKYGIDLFITGHRHQQEMHYKDINAWVKGMEDTAWIVTGGGGGVTSEGNPQYEGPYMQQYGFMDIQISKTEMVIDMWSHTGNKKSSTTVTPRAPAVVNQTAAAQQASDASAACSASPGCAELHGLCCPNAEGTFLGCCNAKAPGTQGQEERRLRGATQAAEGAAAASPAAQEEAEDEEEALREEWKEEGWHERRLQAGCAADRRRGHGGWSDDSGARRRAVQNAGADCWKPCGGKPGYCSGFCGSGNACCRYGARFDPVECSGATFTVTNAHTCVAPGGQKMVMSNEGPELMSNIGPGDIDVKYLDENVFNMQVDLVGEDCLAGCGGKAGHCPYHCGDGRACCMKDNHTDPQECSSANVFGFTTDRHECVMVTNTQLTGGAAWGMTGKELPDGVVVMPEVYNPKGLVPAGVVPTPVAVATAPPAVVGVVPTPVAVATAPPAVVGVVPTPVAVATAPPAVVGVVPTPVAVATAPPAAVVQTPTAAPRDFNPGAQVITAGAGTPTVRPGSPASAPASVGAAVSGAAAIGAIANTVPSGEATTVKEAPQEGGLVIPVWGWILSALVAALLIAGALYLLGVCSGERQKKSKQKKASRQSRGVDVEVTETAPLVADAPQSTQPVGTQMTQVPMAQSTAVAQPAPVIQYSVPVPAAQYSVPMQVAQPIQVFQGTVAGVPAPAPFQGGAPGALSGYGY